MSIDRIFGGATKPPLFLGAPILPFVLVSVTSVAATGTCLVFIHWLPAVAFAFAYLCVLFWMRTISRTDPWRLHQSLLRLRRRLHARPQSRWGGISYAPYRLRRRS